VSEGVPQAQPEADVVRRVEALLAEPATRAKLHSRTFVLEERRVLYVSTPKAACTSLLWLLFRVAGVDPDALADSPSAQPTRSMLVHDRDRFPVPSLATLDTRSLERALAEDGWLRFCVVRNPYARLYSAWEDKVLVGDSAHLERFGTPGATEVVGEDGQLDVRTAFVAFVAELVRRPQFYVTDPHFMPQHELLRPDVLPYTDVVRLERLREFVPRLRAHVVDHGADDPGELPRSNSGLGLSWQGAYDAETAERARELYREDFERWGYDPDGTWSETPPRLPAGELALIRLIREMNERIAALSTLAVRAEAATSAHAVERAGRLRVERHAEELAVAHAQLAEAHAQLAERYEQLAQRHAELEGSDARTRAALDASEARWQALEARGSVRLLRRLQRMERRIRRSR
jgi:hypothetical protein